MAVRLVLAAVLVVGCAATSSCLYQCTTNGDCLQCGDGHSICKGSLPTTRLCTDDPPDPPTEPHPLTAAVPWPQVWAGDMLSLNYADASNKTKLNSGRFFYDWPNMRQKQDFGKTALTYISANAAINQSRFYFVAGPVCVYVHTEDPLTHMDITVTRPDWMQVCAALGAAEYVGREKLRGEWADHYNCSVTYNGETDSFQTWHSLGQGSSSFGTPVALSAGDSTPNWEKPRLNSIWYSNVTVGAGAVPGAAFKLPLICIPIPGTKLLLELGLRNISSLFTAFSNQRIRMRVEELLRDPMLLK